MKLWILYRESQPVMRISRMIVRADNEEEARNIAHKRLREDMELAMYNRNFTKCYELRSEPDFPDVIHCSYE